MNLKGWDIISFTPMKNINQAIKAGWSDITFIIKDEEVSLEGIFGEWSVVEGGGGKFLRMSCPIAAGILSTGETHLRLDGSIAIFHVMLNFFDKITATGVNADVNELDLKFDFRIAKYLTEQEGTEGYIQEEAVQEEAGGIVEPIDLLHGSQVFKYMILNRLADYIVNHPNILRVVLANVALRGKGGNWLSPVKCRYSFLDGVNPYLAIMAVCTDRDISKLPLDVDITGVDLGSKDSFYAVSKELFIRNVGIPCFTALFRSVPDDYAVCGDILSNKWRLYMPSITVGAIDYEPYVETNAAKMWIAGSTLHVDLDSGGCDLYAGITMTWASFNGFSCSYRDGQLLFDKSFANFTHNEDIPWYLRFIPLSFIIDICVACISDSLASGIKIKIDIHAAALNDIRWYGAGINIRNAFLNDGFVIRF